MQALEVDGLAAARERIKALVGRDVDRMDDAACRRAAIESLSENLTDGFTSPLAWYAVGGLPGLVVDRFLGGRELVVRPLDPRLGKIKDISAAALLEDGAPVLIVYRPTALPYCPSIML